MRNPYKNISKFAHRVGWFNAITMVVWDQLTFTDWYIDDEGCYVVTMYL